MDLINVEDKIIDSQIVEVGIKLTKLKEDKSLILCCIILLHCVF